jgi:RNA polymerase sigma-70 factor, ECF subfamily
MKQDDSRKMNSKEVIEDQLTGLYEEYYNKIARYVFVRIGDRSEAEDIASEVFVKALDSLKTYQERGLPMQAWIFRIAHNLVVDYLRKGKQRAVVPIDAVEITSDTDPVTTAETHIEISRVVKAMERLTEDQREVVRLRFFGGLSSKEVSSVMEKTDGSVREMQSAALEKLRQILNETGMMG